MESKNPLRGKGPRVFISYSFSDKVIAKEVFTFLFSQGIQVRKEDESSLTGKNLKKILPDLIGESEVFLPILTQTSNSSMWIQKEIDWALELSNREGFPLILPLVIEKSNLYEPIRDWAYVDASISGISKDILALILKNCMSTIELLPLSKEAIFTLERSRVEYLLVKGFTGKRRVIVDSDGIVSTIFNDVLKSARKSSDPNIEFFIRQEESHYRKVLRKFDLIDMIIPKLFNELRFHFQEYSTEFLYRAIEAVNRFVKLEIGSEILKLKDMVSPNESQLLSSFLQQIETADQMIQEGKVKNPNHGGFGIIYWALGSHPMNKSQEWIRIALDSKEEKEGLITYFPKSGIGSDWQIILQIGGSPEPYIYNWDWAEFVLPQIASRTIKLMDRFDLSLEETIETTGWRISDYKRLGYP